MTYVLSIDKNEDGTCFFHTDYIDVPFLANALDGNANIQIHGIFKCQWWVNKEYFYLEPNNSDFKVAKDLDSFINGKIAISDIFEVFEIELKADAEINYIGSHEDMVWFGLKESENYLNKFKRILSASDKLNNQKLSKLLDLCNQNIGNYLFYDTVTDSIEIYPELYGN
ncbi:MAG: hypothetical protein M0D57_07440 [Sphingobacteriales bacterium JAD_PAG50586_3]|nr:MAG: hypothetical protein M0D57_07440 [Sphingobacteriales bacterium JAD_PAG50586_3]